MGEKNQNRNEQFQLDDEQALIKQLLVTESQLKIAREEQSISGEPLRKVLVKLGFVTESRWLSWLENDYGYPVFSLGTSFEIDRDLVQEVPSDLSYSNRILPLSLDETTQTLNVAVLDPFDVSGQDLIRGVFSDVSRLEIYVATEKDIIAGLDFGYQQPLIVQELMEEKESHYLAANTEIPSSEGAGLVDAIIDNAVKSHASDIHFEPQEGFVRVRIRVDGVLQETDLFHVRRWATVLSRLKILSGMNIAETRLPQSGRFSQQCAGRLIDFRASAHPTSGGENFVIRILDRLHTFFELEELGFPKEQVSSIKRQLEKPHGIFIVTGPTGSGKTTTLYSMLSYLRSHERNIMTLEDPVEYDLNGIRQSQIQPEIGFDFAQGVRSLLRQDPDVLLIGEIRDEDTARMAVRASMTGHLVLTTLHTNNALTAFSRLIDLGVSPELLSGSVNCVLSQRLIRKSISVRTIASLGRQPVAELLTVTPTLDSLLSKRAPYHDCLEMAQKQGYTPMVESAKELIEKGVIDEEDARRVLFFEESA